jgi:hypothetical protein
MLKVAFENSPLLGVGTYKPDPGANPLRLLNLQLQLQRQRCS